MSLKCDNENEIIQNIIKLLNDDNLQKKLIKNQAKIINKNSAYDLVKFIKEKF